jgi:hypothetical protein
MSALAVRKLGLFFIGLRRVVRPALQLVAFCLMFVGTWPTTWRADAPICFTHMIADILAISYNNLSQEDVRLQET